jgi:nucleoside-diphosphate-sugar epimerase
MRILITGGAGFIGTHLAERFCPDHDIVLMDNFRRDALKYVPALKNHPRVRLIDGDILNPESTGEALRGVDSVIHLAAIAGVSSYDNESLRTLQVNILGTNAMLEAAVRAGVKHFVHFSTSETYGPDALWVDELSRHGIGPVSERRWVYAVSKLAGEHLTLRTGEATGMKATVVRPFNIYGPRQIGEGAIGNFCRAAISKNPLRVEGDGSAIRAWCYISDMVDAVEATLERPEAAGQVFNIGNPAEVESTLGLARQVCRLAPGATIERSPMKGAEVRARIPSIGKARDLLGFEPKVSLEDGLSRTLRFFEGAAQ